MSLELIWQAVARQAAAIQGVKGAYAWMEDSTTTVHTWPEDVADGPVALVNYAGSEMLSAPPFEHLAHDFDIDLWIPLGNANKAAGVAALAPLFERFVVAFRQNIGLYGTAHTNQILGSSGFEEDTLNEKPYLVQTIALRTREARSVTAAIGPTS